MGGTHQKLSFLDGSGSKRVAELNLDAANGHKDVRDGLAGEGRGLSDEDETRINDAAMDLNEGHVLEAATVAHITVPEKLQHQSLAPIVRWERFLPLRTLKVLLVENDDSTRQVLSALLRNCCYEVTAVANGLEAWRILQDLTNHIDLVLTEVVMPGWSGIGLLCKIMSHKTCKTIPVIMMSSNDSMGIVFKCLSKGAVDFLVKPIRKNELKNLWQHVWRRCHSSSGSASESGIQGQKCTKSKSEDDSANNTGSNDEEDIGNIGLSARDGSDNGSGTQSSWTKRPFEADSPQAISPSEQESVPHDSTCAHVIHPAPDASLYGNNMPANMPANTGAGHKEQKKIADPGNESNQTDKVSTKLTGPSTDKSPADNLPPKDADDDIVRRTNLNNTLNEPTTTRPPHPPTLNSSQNNDHGAAQLPSLKRLRSTATPSTDERNVVLKRSNQSAFSRYPASATSVVRRNSVPDNQCSNGSPGISKDASASAFRRVQSQGSAMQEKIDGADVAPAKGSLKQVQVQHHHHHYHHYHHHIHALQPRPEQDCSSVEKLEANAANYSNSGSNHGSDGQNGYSAVVNAGGTNMESAAGGVAAKGGAGGAGGGGGGDGACQNRFGQREAALNKFRQKRKERNFAKKVRYQSRKRLAEQRPRVRGQFVRRATHSENRDEDS